MAPLNQSLKAVQTKCAQKFQRIRYFVNLDRLKPSRILMKNINEKQTKKRKPDRFWMGGDFRCVAITLHS